MNEIVDFHSGWQEGGQSCDNNEHNSCNKQCFQKGEALVVSEDAFRIGEGSIFRTCEEAGVCGAVSLISVFVARSVCCIRR